MRETNETQSLPIDEKRRKSNHFNNFLFQQSTIFLQTIASRVAMHENITKMMMITDNDDAERVKINRIDGEDGLRDRDYDHY